MAGDPNVCASAMLIKYLLKTIFLYYFSAMAIIQTTKVLLPTCMARLEIYLNLTKIEEDLTEYNIAIEFCS
jgi:hypothetical protein